SPELKVVGPSMLGIGCPDRHALRRITPIKCADRELRSPPARAGSFIGAQQSTRRWSSGVGSAPIPAGRVATTPRGSALGQQYALSCARLNGSIARRLRTFVGDRQSNRDRPEYARLVKKFQDTKGHLLLERGCAHVQWRPGLALERGGRVQAAST